MSVNHLLADASAPVGAYALTSGRLWASLAALVALAGVAVGGWALVRSARRGGVTAVTAGLLGIVIGGWVLAVAQGGPGTGYGTVGAWAALVLGAIAVVLGGLVMARTRRPVG
ncbi:DUF6223 family protein [Spongiactinospora sp. TRM90649]|uniref:DUF6223 family protein n=1 Tax=Spongiactinospora sp. TRM90649 TaxID=3031114 RepID=UPI0023F9F16A|nr:DUF6223 family protein [Spongiactinospora sp. TRM90649]MDF5754378.1 DUF6223 family protein [Spongiactinospora sp. TRM90649]